MPRFERAKEAGADGARSAAVERWGEANDRRPAAAEGNCAVSVMAGVAGAWAERGAVSGADRAMLAAGGWGEGCAADGPAVGGCGAAGPTASATAAMVARWVCRVLGGAAAS
jgi:hypothetical protein